MDGKVMANPIPKAFPETQASDEAVSYLAEEFNHWQDLFSIQPPLTQRFLEAQGRKLANALSQHAAQVRFSLPDRVVVKSAMAGDKQGQVLTVPSSLRDQMAGGLMERLSRSGFPAALRQRLDELESNSEPAVVSSAGLVRYATIINMVHNMLPSGRTVEYQAAPGEEIPTIPVTGALEPASAITAATDVIIEPDSGSSEEGRGELIVPYVPAASHFYLPQWVAFDEQDRLLVGSLDEAQAHIASMQRFVNILHAAVGLAPYMVADPEYQHKRYGILGQLVNQGRALARYETGEIIQTILRRAAANDLNRGLSLSLPYFDDQSLVQKQHDFDIIPAGRIMFVPAFVVLACRRERAKVAQDTRLSPSTRKHLLAELLTLEQAFETAT
jgi:hypothetical protein